MEPIFSMFSGIDFGTDLSTNFVSSLVIKIESKNKLEE